LRGISTVAQSPKGRPAKPPKEKAEKPQIQRFKDLARELECDETGEAFERAFAKIVPAKRPK
jgi:hypothetical protein